jgi:hypothetical protein
MRGGRELPGGQQDRRGGYGRGSGPCGSAPCQARWGILVVAVYEAHAARGEASGWDVGATDYDNPQFYILGPGPDLDCIVAISRVGRIYVLENGTGRLLDESASLETLASRAKMPAARLRHVPLLARITLSLAAFKLALGEKAEPILVESEELLLRIAPQLAAFV